jgi:uncharacterized protein YdaU (DUF1376 family)
MSRRPWIAFYMGDYLKDTMHLTTEQHGAYLLLLMECWTQGRIPTDLQGQAVIVRMPVHRWGKVGPAVLKYFQEDGTNFRASEEIIKAERIRVQKSIAGVKGGRKSGISRIIAKGEASRNEAETKQTPKQTPKRLPKQKRSISQATHISSITTTSFLAAREEAELPLPAPALATALCDGALAPGPTPEQAEPKRSAEKKPSDLTRAELDQLYAKRRDAKANPQPTAGAA